LLTKELLSCRVVEIPIDKSMLNPQRRSSITITARETQTFLLSMVTAADICQRTNRLVICNYGEAYLLQPQVGETKLWDDRRIQRIPLPYRKQGEAIAFADSEHLLLTSESAPMPLWTVAIKSVVSTAEQPASVPE
jgi:hypothetical protein